MRKKCGFLFKFTAFLLQFVISGSSLLAALFYLSSYYTLSYFFLFLYVFMNLLQSLVHIFIYTNFSGEQISLKRGLGITALSLLTLGSYPLALYAGRKARNALFILSIALSLSFMSSYWYYLFLDKMFSRREEYQGIIFSM
ncbi:hypothetical protein IOK49_01425 [Fervidicoccus fontis]|uniref:Uncharacterized protein n=2 Tax=Fervidicoccus fontis TaxID=683846 RepID=I0A313_FERFK|nr:hypothetical protein [Fervidicoccus fontis]AFH43370.1 hypothetical protein FFONT_1382 [Fervidicoccus fontis Kam940]MBE9390747.1 hypothetical protein [Fervidicoccus fontis]PNV81272.1 MAG: phosphoethanolamine transferase CptA [Fervidicoccus sp.]